MVVESDNRLTVDFVTKRIALWTEVESLVESIWELILLFRDVSFSFNYRRCNNVADKITKYARLFGLSEVWVGNIPDWLCNLVDYDRSLIAHVAL